MSSKKSAFKLGEIEETVYPDISQEVEYEIITNDEAVNSIIDFCIDSKGKVRKAVGIIAYDNESEENPDYVPRKSFSLKSSPWNSHSLYFELELPNPAEDFEYYQKIRNAMLAEMTIRLNRQKKNAKARISRQVSEKEVC